MKMIFEKINLRFLLSFLCVVRRFVGIAFRIIGCLFYWILNSFIELMSSIKKQLFNYFCKILEFFIQVHKVANRGRLLIPRILFIELCE